MVFSKYNYWGELVYRSMPHPNQLQDYGYINPIPLV